MKFIQKHPLIILIAGRARSGKSTLAQYFTTAYQQQQQLVINSPYTKYLKQYIENITQKPITDTNKPRDLLQKISSDLIKKELGYNDFFIKRQLEDLAIYSYFADVIIIPDVRFKEEITIIKEKYPNVFSIGITRVDFQSDLTNEQQQDITETALDNYHDYDFEVKNTTNTNLESIALTLMEKIKERRYTNE